MTKRIVWTAGYSRQLLPTGNVRNQCAALHQEMWTADDDVQNSHDWGTSWQCSCVHECKCLLVTVPACDIVRVSTCVMLCVRDSIRCGRVWEVSVDGWRRLQLRQRHWDQPRHGRHLFSHHFVHSLSSHVLLIFSSFASLFCQNCDLIFKSF